MKYAWHKKTFNIVNILVSGIFHGHFAQRLAVNKPCLQIVRRLLWKQTTTHSIRNNNPIFDREEPLVKQIRPTVYLFRESICCYSDSQMVERKKFILMTCGQTTTRGSQTCSTVPKSMLVLPWSCHQEKRKSMWLEDGGQVVGFRYSMWRRSNGVMVSMGREFYFWTSFVIISHFLQHPTSLSKAEYEPRPQSHTRIPS